MVGRLGTGNDHGQGRVHHDPAQGKLRHGRACGHQRAQLLHRRQTHLIGHARKRLAHVKRLTIAVETAVIIRRKGAGRCHLACQQARGQRHPRNHRHAQLFRRAKEPLRRARTKHVVDDLHRCHTGPRNGGHRLRHRFHADAIARNDATRLQIIQRIENGIVVIGHRWRAMQLQQIKAIHLQVAARTVNERRQIAVTFCHMWRKPAPGLCRHKGARAGAGGQHFGNQAF